MPNEHDEVAITARPLAVAHTGNGLDRPHRPGPHAAASATALCMLGALVAGCGGWQSASTLPDGYSVAVCTPHILGLAGGTTPVIKTVCEVDFEAVAATRARAVSVAPRREAWMLPTSTASGLDGALLAYPGSHGRYYEQTPQDAADEIAALLSRTDPIAGVGDPGAAWRILHQLSMRELLDTLDRLDPWGAIGPLWALRAQYSTKRTDAAFGVHLLARMDLDHFDSQALTIAAEALEQAGRADQALAYQYMLDRRGVGPEMRELIEGIIALSEARVKWREPVVATGATVLPNLPGPIEPLPFRPGREPPWLHIGNAAHKSIALHYQVSNPGDSIASNSVPISTILNELMNAGHSPTPGVLTLAERRSRPDIVNLTKLHVYEIKPARSQVAAGRQAMLYLGRFGKAGITMSLGPSGAPGTTGALPAPGGVFLFWSPEPGVIVYDFRWGRLVPVHVRVPAEATETAREPTTERSRWPSLEWNWKLEPLSPAIQRAFATAALGTALLILMMILLAPVGA